MTPTDLAPLLLVFARYYSIRDAEAWALDKAEVWAHPLADFDRAEILAACDAWALDHDRLPSLHQLRAACHDVRATRRASERGSQGCDDCAHTGLRLVAVHRTGLPGKPSGAYDRATWHQYAAGCDCPLGRGLAAPHHAAMARLHPEALAVVVTDASKPRLDQGGMAVPAVTWDDLRARLRNPRLRLAAQRVLRGHGDEAMALVTAGDAQ